MQSSLCSLQKECARGFCTIWSVAVVLLSSSPSLSLWMWQATYRTTTTLPRSRVQVPPISHTLVLHTVVMIVSTDHCMHTFFRPLPTHPHKHQFSITSHTFAGMLHIAPITFLVVCYTLFQSHFCWYATHCSNHIFAGILHVYTRYAHFQTDDFCWYSSCFSIILTF